MDQNENTADTNDDVESQRAEDTLDELQDALQTEDVDSDASDESDVESSTDDESDAESSTDDESEAGPESDDVDDDEVESADLDEFVSALDVEDGDEDFSEIEDGVELIGPKFNPNRPYGKVFGDPNRVYLQNDCHYNSDGELIEVLGEVARVPARRRKQKPEPAQPSQTGMSLQDFNPLQTQADIARENQRAAAAEANAE